MSEHTTPSAVVLSEGHGFASAPSWGRHSVDGSGTPSLTGVPFAITHAHFSELSDWIVHVQVACCVKLPHWKPTTQMYPSTWHLSPNTPPSALVVAVASMIVRGQICVAASGFGVGLVDEQAMAMGRSGASAIASVARKSVGI